MALSPVASANSALLTSIQGNQALVDRYQQRLVAGRAVSSALDNAPAFALAQGLTQRAETLGQVGAQVGQGIGALQAAQTGIDAIGKVVGQLKSLAQLAQASSDPNVQTQLATQYNALAGQIDTIVGDASYGGVNLIKASPDTLTVSGPGQTLSTSVSGQAADSVSLGITPAGAWSTSSATIAADIAKLDQASQSLGRASSSLGSNTANLQTVAAYATAQAQTASSGAAKLTTADQAEAAASAQAAQTYRQLGLNALRNQVHSQDSVLALFSR
ncbi:putative Flagellin gene flaB [Candidatus Terasakiella magnetica]|nr:putative Flagellin gene flaB [Candidatus Terasakiella magnetica]